MSPEQKAAYIYAQAVAASIELEMMKAHNAESLRNERPLEYSPDDFYKIIDRYGLGHNAIWHTIHQ